MVLWGYEVNATGSGSAPMTGLFISGVEHESSVTRGSHLYMYNDRRVYADLIPEVSWCNKSEFAILELVDASPHCY
jgi:hypothetical protein